MNILLSEVLVVAVAIGSAGSLQASEAVVSDHVAAPSYELVLRENVKWEQLNPARGDKSPRAGTLWGDRNGSEATGYLLKPMDGFQSPPHIHNVTYRGVVISGLIHNDDPTAVEMWMPAGSFWTQPKGESHITAAKGNSTLAYIEIDEGPYLVLPTDEAFDSGERPVNVDVSNIVWLEASNISWLQQAGMPTSGNAPEIGFLWGKPQDGHVNGVLLKLPAGFNGTIDSQASTFRAVLIQGQVAYQATTDNNSVNLAPGSYFGSMGAAQHSVTTSDELESIIYIRTDGKINITPN
ncbi:DUF4437 domain-containing protein [Corallincola holothuriorum]|uniref:DUF4437 domain-containing protein n=1 Tax=Corallincola holothuriorum TaxID=2282215 RepID=A0A368N6Y8_9GAMM|nr:DUF4437 domain-containing protein [Corallincola holothuriorum]RCU45304.1 DUF4437 domain-containing protein [Corallincola holothuriorum]